MTRAVVKPNRAARGVLKGGRLSHRSPCTIIRFTSQRDNPPRTEHVQGGEAGRFEHYGLGTPCHWLLIASLDAFHERIFEPAIVRFE